MRATANNCQPLIANITATDPARRFSNVTELGICLLIAIDVGLEAQFSSYLFWDSVFIYHN